MTSTRTKTRVAKAVIGLWTVAAVVGIPSAASANHQCDAIEIPYFCPFTWGTGSVCIGDPHGEGHGCVPHNE
ncbi:MAG TPA: hypothetical protein VG318_09420 [Actinomycetota bacterium]|nr:hypothetical protein [Actinomycetota bacterium]